MVSSLVPTQPSTEGAGRALTTPMNKMDDRDGIQEEKQIFALAAFGTCGLSRAFRRRLRRVRCTARLSRASVSRDTFLCLRPPPAAPRIQVEASAPRVRYIVIEVPVPTPPSPGLLFDPSFADIWNLEYADGLHDEWHAQSVASAPHSLPTSLFDALGSPVCAVASDRQPTSDDFTDVAGPETTEAFNSSDKRHMPFIAINSACADGIDARPGITKAGGNSALHQMPRAALTIEVIDDSDEVDGHEKDEHFEHAFCTEDSDDADGDANKGQAVFATDGEDAGPVTPEAYGDQLTHHMTSFASEARGEPKAPQTSQSFVCPEDWRALRAVSKSYRRSFRDILQISARDGKDEDEEEGEESCSEDEGVQDDRNLLPPVVPPTRQAHRYAGRDLETLFTQYADFGKQMSHFAFMRIPRFVYIFSGLPDGTFAPIWNRFAGSNNLMDFPSFVKLIRRLEGNDTVASEAGSDEDL